MFLECFHFQCVIMCCLGLCLIWLWILLFRQVGVLFDFLICYILILHFWMFFDWIFRIFFHCNFHIGLFSFCILLFSFFSLRFSFSIFYDFVFLFSSWVFIFNCWRLSFVFFVVFLYFFLCFCWFYFDFFVFSVLVVFVFSIRVVVGSWLYEIHMGENPCWLSV